MMAGTRGRSAADLRKQEWISDSNETIELKLGSKIHFTSGSLLPYIHFTFTDKVTGAMDVMTPLLSQMPKHYTDNEEVFLEWCRRDEVGFKPMGEKVFEYRREEGESRYVVYKCKFSTPGFKEYHRRLQTFLLWFIEGSSFIDETDTNWECTLVFEQRDVVGEGRQTYHIVGYATAYRFFHFPEKERMRISQFLVLPPYQRKGHGAELYKYLHREYLGRDKVVDFGVEDPSDDFMDLRDLCDFKYYKEHQYFLGMAPPIPVDVIESVRRKTKLSKKQSERICEMVLLSQIEMRNREVVKAFRVMVKRRLFRYNEEEKLGETYEAVVEGYRDVVSHG
ncbi:acyl-CoA N-acyltransferase [Chytridium lagenaria]|nr:acyl-CoA N-acyltransferase [Chytridium lagenaria]